MFDYGVKRYPGTNIDHWLTNRILSWFVGVEMFLFSSWSYTSLHEATAYDSKTFRSHLHWHRQDEIKAYDTYYHVPFSLQDHHHYALQ